MADRIRSIGWTGVSAPAIDYRAESRAGRFEDCLVEWTRSKRVSPRVMMKIYRALRVELRKHGLSPTSIMPVAGIDPGTLEDRFTGLAWRGSVIAKTGTLIRTDGGASSLVGQMRAANGEVLLFVIMNQRGSVGGSERTMTSS